MNKVLTFTGGHKFHAEDLDHLVSSIIETNTAFALALGSDQDPSKVLILSGVVLGGSVGARTWTEGWAYWNSELFFVPAQVAPVVTSTFDLEINETFLVGNPVTYLDATPRNVHAIRTLTSILGAGEFGVAELNDTNRLANRLGNKIMIESNLILLNELGWLDALTNGVTLAASWAVNETLQYRIIGSKIEWRGLLTYSGVASNQPLFTDIPTSTRPNIDRDVPVGIIQGGSRLAVISFLSTPATVISLADNTFATGQVLNMDTVHYYKR